MLTVIHDEDDIGRNVYTLLIRDSGKTTLDDYNNLIKDYNVVDLRPQNSYIVLIVGSATPIKSLVRSQMCAYARHWSAIYAMVLNGGHVVPD